MKVFFQHINLRIDVKVDAKKKILHDDAIPNCNLPKSSVARQITKSAEKRLHERHRRYANRNIKVKRLVILFLDLKTKLQIRFTFD